MRVFLFRNMGCGKNRVLVRAVQGRGMQGYFQKRIFQITSSYRYHTHPIQEYLNCLILHFSALKASCGFKVALLKFAKTKCVCVCEREMNYLENVMIEEHVQLLVGVVDAELLKAVAVKVLEAKNIEDADKHCLLFTWNVQSYNNRTNKDNLFIGEINQYVYWNSERKQKPKKCI